jgi:chromosome segregation ATPase
MQSALESAHGDLRGELQALMSAVTVQRQDFDRRCRDVEDRLAPAESERDALREQLAAAQVSREAAAGEVAGLRAELDRLGSELAVSREQMSAHGGDLGEAQRLLTDARALTEQLRGQNPQ